MLLRHALTAPAIAVPAIAVPLLLAPLSALAHAGDPVPLLRYDFEDLADPTANLGSLGAAHAGDLQGDAGYTAFGAGQAVALDGDGDFVLALGPEDPFDLGDGDFSAKIRLRTSNLQATDATRGLVWKEGADCTPQWFAAVSQLTGRMRFGLSDGTTCFVTDGKKSVADGLPHDVTVTRTGGWVRIDVDGKCDALKPIPAGMLTAQNAGALVVGGRALAQAPPSDVDDFLGEIDEVSVFGEALFAPPPPWSATPYGCALNPPGSLSHVSGTATPGGVLVLGVDNPYGTQGPGSVAVVAVAGLPAVGFPCGTPFPGFGMAGPTAMGELLVSLFPAPLAVIGSPWFAPGFPASVVLPLPNSCNLVGKPFYVQGFLVDPNSTIGIGIAAASGLVIKVGV